MKICPEPKKKQITGFKQKQREFHQELRKLREIKKFGPLLDKSAVQIALTKFQDKVVYVKSNNLHQLDIWDLKTHRLLHTFEDAHEDTIYPIVMTSNQNYLLTGSADKTIAVWDLENLVLSYRFEAAHQGTITSLVTSGGNKMIAASASFDKSIGIWDLNEKNLVCRFDKAHITVIYALAMTTNGEFLISSDEQTIAVWNITDRKIHHRFLEAHCNSIYCLAVTSDNKYFASGSADGTVRIWDLRDNILVEEVENEESAEIWSITVSATHSKNLIFGSDDGSVSTWTILGYDHTPKKIPNE